MGTLLSLAFWGFVLASSLIAFPIAVLLWAVTAPFDPHRRLLHRFSCAWASLYTWLNPAWRVTVEGRDRIERGRAYVMVANHESLLDILVLFRLHVHFVWVSKVENFRVPLIGWNMALNRYIKLRRGKRASVLEMFRACEAALRRGESIMMFPEGTRSTDGRLRPFKPGAFELALRQRVPILPLAIEGTAAALPKRGFRLRGRHHIHLQVLDAIPYEGFAHLDPTELARRVRDGIARELGQSEPEAALPSSAAGSLQ